MTISQKLALPLWISLDRVELTDNFLNEKRKRVAILTMVMFIRLRVAYFFHIGPFMDGAFGINPVFTEP